MSKSGINESGGDRMDAIKQVAASWCVRRQEKLDSSEEEEFTRWIEADSLHAEIYYETEETSRLLDQLLEPNVISTKTESPVFVFPAPLALKPVSSLVVCRQRWRLAAVALAAAAALIIFGMVWWRPSPAAYACSETTEVGGLRRLKLPDGSEVLLNTDSAVEVKYSATERRVRLVQGEAFFSVAKNSQRPFWVQAGEISVRAVGTAFNVRFRETSVEVLVTEGKVRVGDNSGQSVLPSSIQQQEPVSADSEKKSQPNLVEALLVAGHKADIPLSTSKVDLEKLAPTAVTVAIIEPRKIMNALAWRVHRLEFSSMPLSQVVAEFNRYNHHKLVIADPTLAAQLFGGAFDANAYDSFIEALEQSFGVVAEVHANETILRKGS